MKKRSAGFDIWLRPGPFLKFFVLEVDDVCLDVLLLLVVLIQNSKSRQVLPVQKFDVFDEQLVKPERVRLIPK